MGSPTGETVEPDVEGQLGREIGAAGQTKKDFVLRIKAATERKMQRRPKRLLHKS
jgi:hypothetical protein